METLIIYIEDDNLKLKPMMKPVLTAISNEEIDETNNRAIEAYKMKTKQHELLLDITKHTDWLHYCYDQIIGCYYP